GVELQLTDNGRNQTLQVDYLLAATGRRPNLRELDLEAAGIPLDDKGLPFFNDVTGQIGDTHLFIAGDASNAHPLLHEAADDGRIAGDNAGRFPEVRVRPRRAPLLVIFTDPQIMLTGATYAELTNAGAAFAVGEMSFS